MAEAELTRIHPDARLAQSFLSHARGFLRDGENDSLGRSSRQVLLHNAVIAACDATLSIEGFRVVGSEGGHVLRLEKTEELLGDGLEDLFEQLHAVRLARAEVSYAAGFVPPSELDEALLAVERLIEHVADYLGQAGENAAPEG